MRRLIPKNSKMRVSLFNGLSLTDMLIICVALLLSILIFASNINGKWIFLAVFIFTTVLLLIGSGEDKTYMYIYYLLHFAASKKVYLKHPKNGKKKASVDNLLPFKSILDNGIIEYDGYFGAVVEIGSVSFELLDEAEQDRRIAAFSQVLNDLSQSTVIQLVKIDRPINYSDISARLFQKIQEAKAAGEDPAKIAVLEARLEQIDNINNVETQYRPYYYLVLFDDKKDALSQQVDVCRSGFDIAGLDAEMLSAKDVAVFFKYCYTRDFNERDAEDVSIGNYADYVKPDTVKFKIGSYVMDDVYAFTIAIRDYPLYVGNSWAANLFGIEHTKVVMTIKPVDKDKAIKRIDKTFVEASTRRNGKLSEANEQQTHLETLADLQQALQNENQILYDVTLTITAFNRTDKSNNAFRKDIRRQLLADGYRVSHLLGRQFEGFAASTVAKRFKLRGFERGINSDSLAAMFPFVFSSVIDPDGITLGYGTYPVILDPWKRGPQHVNSNGVIFGKSGSGKSFFQKTLLLNVYSDNSRIFILDPENEYQTLAKNVGGAFIDVGSAVRGRINPLHIYPVLTDEGELAPSEVVFSSHLQFLDSFFRITLSGITFDSLEELNNLIVEMYEGKGITQEKDCTQLDASAFPSFDDLLKTCDEKLKSKKMSMQRRENLERVKTYIKKFATGGMYANLWNGASTLKTDERLVVFNFQSLFSSKNKTVANAQILVVMRYLDQQIINIREQNRSSEGEMLHPLVIVDEGYNFIDPKYPIALDFIFQWYKRIRKYEGSILFATQNLSDVLGNTEVAAKTTAIVNNSQYSFIFALAPADLDILTELYRNSGGINDTERAQISNAGCGDCFAICSSRDRASFHVYAHDTVRSLFEDDGVILSVS